MPKLNLSRDVLAKIAQGNQRAVIALEQVFDDVGDTFPSTIEEANALAGSALAVAQSNAALLSLLVDALSRLETMPAQVPQVDSDDTTPRTHLGTISAQNHDSVAITGGTANFDAGTVAAPSLTLGGDTSSGLYRSAPDVLDIAIAGAKLIELATQLVTITGALTVSNQITSTVATGTAPLVVASTTLVANLHAAVADSLGTASAYPANATDLASCITLANALKAANTAKGV
ncbi:hypothetical protein [Massilia sp. CT11-137]|uniref:hypothetical protein n=1 Tax=Massilia sp. CT11-137 TaxID=3393901 RepID=UPI0039AFB631